MATIRDVAKAAGVSTATVSAVMNDSAYVSPELRSRVQAAIEALDYAPSHRGAEPEARQKPAHRHVGRRSGEPVLHPHRVPGGSGGGGLGLFAGGVQQRRKDRGREAHPDPHPRAVVRRHPAGAGGRGGAASAARSRRPHHSDRAVRPRGRRPALRHRHHRQQIRRPAGDQLPARSRPSAHRLDHRPAASHHRQGPLRRHDAGVAGARRDAACRITSARASSAKAPPIRWRARCWSGPTARARSMSPTA